MDKNTAYQTVKAARSQDKILTSDLIKKLVDGFFELHGDRKAGDDPAVIAGIGYLADHPITVVGISKGKDTDSNINVFTLRTDTKHHQLLFFQMQ